MMYTLNCKGKLLTINKPIVMGIINTTPDSFYQGHLQQGIDKMSALAGQMLLDGADILDVGGQSTRPGSERLDADAEIARVVPVIEAILQKHPGAIVSVDTYHSKVAATAVAAGASIVNDISGGTMDADMLHTVAALQTPYICMHIKGTPDTMQQQANYSDVTLEVLDYFIEKTEACKRAGIHDVIIDPGFGFGKTAEHNFRLLKQLSAFSILQKPILAGLSRKSTIYKTLGITAAEALNGTTALNTIALMNGAHILRVHDVKEAKEAVTLFEAYNNA
ncbi:MAG TPA: dihydropteroate synthase [Ferruginibacter sp.]|nr:dihydropteroate synthase [Ferruginibacter sp.]HMP21527.1 dihydropteroate synthase [Ferruginibacter sp.]